MKELVESWQIILANYGEPQSILCTWLKWKSTLISKTVLLINVNWRIWMKLISNWTFSFFSLFIAGEIIKVFLSWTKLSTFNCVSNLAGSSPLNYYTWKFCLYVDFFLLCLFRLVNFFQVPAICWCLIHFVNV